jgi:hypothetical protein
MPLVLNSSSITGIGSGGLYAPGHVMQVVTTTSTTVVTNTTGTYADLVSVSITPSSATSRVMLFFSGQFNMVSATECFTKYQLVRTSTSIYTAGLGTLGALFISAANVAYVDSPSTTSATTYKIQFAKDSGSTTSTASSGSYSITALEIGA